MRFTSVCLTLLLVVSEVPCLAATKAAKPPKAPKPKLTGIQKALQKRIPKFTVSASLKDVLERISKTANVRMAVHWPGLRRVGGRPGDKVIFSAAKATASQLLDLTLSKVAKNKEPLSWYIDRDIVHVTTQLNAIYRSRLVTAMARPRSARTYVGTNTFEFNAVPIKKVFDYLSAVSGTNMAVNWRSLDAEEIGPDEPITLRVSNVSTARALDLVLDQLNGGRDKLQRVYWLVEGGVVSITTGTAMNANLRVRVFHVGDLLMSYPQVQQPGPFTLRRRSDGGDDSRRGEGDTGGWLGAEGGGRDRNDSETGSADQRKLIEETLIDLIKDTIGEDMWRPIGKGSIRIHRGSLIISQTQLGFKLMNEALRGR